MKPRLAMAVLIALALVALLGSGTIAAEKGGKGKGGGEDVGGVIVAHAGPGKHVVMAAVDGSGLVEVDCGGDLTHGGAPRYFLHAQTIVGESYPDDVQRTELFVYDEDCSSGVRLTDDPRMNRRFARWAPNGERVAWSGTRFAEDGSILEQGIFVSDVTVNESGRPSAITNVRLAVELPTPVVVSWSGDSRRVTYSLYVGSTSHIFVADLVTCAANPKLCIPTATDSATSGYYPAFSPAANRLAFVRLSGEGGPSRNDIFVLDLDTGEETQVTSKKNANVGQLIQPSWSPDGAHLAFSALSISLGDYGANIYRLRADGKGKAVELANSSSVSYASPLWRK